MTDFAYHRSVAPMMWAFVSIACVELIVVHILVSLWSVAAALMMSVVSFATIVWLVRAIRSFHHLPVRLDGDRLIMRTGHLRSIDIARSNVKGLRHEWDAAAIRDRSLLKLSIIAWPNIVVELHEPVMSGGPRSRPVIAIAHRLDDPAAFATVLARHGTVHPQTS